MSFQTEARHMESDLKHVRVMPSRRERSRCFLITVATLVTTNVASLGAVLAMALSPKSPTLTPAASSLSSAVFSGQHQHSTVLPTLNTPRGAISSPHFQRSEISYAGTEAAAYVVAAGVNKIHDASANPTHEVHLEILNGSTFGEFTGPDGRVGPKSLQLRFVDLSTRSEAVLIPMSLSLHGGKTLVPNLYFFSYMKSPGATPVTTFVSTVQGTYVFQNDVGRSEWEAFMLPALNAYGTAWVADHPAAARALRQRRLQSGFGQWAAGKVGGAIGSDLGGSYGGIAGSALGKMADGGSASSALSSAGWSAASHAATSLMGSAGGDAVSALHGMDNGESFGDATGSAIGASLGSAAGSTFGADLGGTAGAALGGAVGGPLGAAVGEEVGSWAGKAAGGYVGGKIGSELGGDLGTDLENDWDSWTR